MIPAGRAGRFEVQRLVGSAGAVHHHQPPEPPTPLVWIVEATTTALVLGSSQHADDLVDPAAATTLGLEVVRRRSGGGAVLVTPGEVVWIDVIVPRGDQLWDDDVGRASWWLGAAWAAALEALGVAGVRVHRGGMEGGELGRLICFASVGPGEVLAPAGGKVVGMSQRRTRHVARFQSACLLRWDPSSLATLMPGAGAAMHRLEAAGSGVGSLVSAEALTSAFLEAVSTR